MNWVFSGGGGRYPGGQWEPRLVLGPLRMASGEPGILGTVGDKSGNRVGAGVEAWWWLWGLRCVLRAQGNHGRLLSRAGACVCLCARPLPDLPLGKLFGGSIALTVPLV